MMFIAVQKYRHSVGFRELFVFLLELNIFSANFQRSFIIYTHSGEIKQYIQMCGNFEWFPLE